MKKGFLNSKESAGSLYGDSGSKEGVLPENAGDPMGWMPKKLRQSAKIVDCNSPEYQAHEAQKKKAEEQNDMNKEFRDTLMSSFGAMQSKQDKWEADLPDGTEDASSIKYDNDYSRFDRIEEEVDVAKVDDRDWYYDSTGQRRQIDARQPEASGSQVTGSGHAPEISPAVKKGFLDNAKKPLYGPEGSNQSKTAPTDDEMLQQLGNLMGQDTSLLTGGAAPGYPSGATKVSVKTPERKKLDFTLTEVADDLQLVVLVPELRSMEGVNLDVVERKVSLDFPSSLGFQPLHVELPAAVVPASVRAKFSKKSKTLTVTLPRAYK
jgi:hypothetical protein